MATTPVFDHIFVEKPDHTKQGALFINAPVDPAAPRLAKVLAVGSGRPSDYTGAIIPMPDVKVGDWILMHGNEGIRLTSEGESVYAIVPRAIIAVKQHAPRPCTCPPEGGCSTGVPCDRVRSE